MFCFKEAVRSGELLRVFHDPNKKSYDLLGSVEESDWFIDQPKASSFNQSLPAADFVFYALMLESLFCHVSFPYYIQTIT